MFANDFTEKFCGHQTVIQDQFTPTIVDCHMEPPHNQPVILASVIIIYSYLFSYNNTLFVLKRSGKVQNNKVKASDWNQTVIQDQFTTNSRLPIGHIHITSL